MRVDFHVAAAREAEDARAPMRHAAAEHGTRRILLEHFPFTLYYRVREDVITIVAVAHQKRRPGYWQSR